MGLKPVDHVWIRLTAAAALSPSLCHDDISCGEAVKALVICQEMLRVEISHEKNVTRMPWAWCHREKKLLNRICVQVP